MTFFTAFFPSFAALWAYDPPDRPHFEQGQTLDIVVDGHHGHRKVGARLTNSPDSLTAYLLYGTKYVFYPRPYFGNIKITLLLAFG